MKICSQCSGAFSDNELIFGECPSCGNTTFEENIDAEVTSIITHNGKFHADDIVSVALLKTIFPNATLIRSRSPEIINNVSSSTLLVDVGMEYDVNKLKFDHHMNSINGEKASRDFASVNLIWKHFGYRYILKIAKEKKLQIKNNSVCEIWKQFSKNIISPIQASDLGRPQSAMKYITLQSIINDCNGNNNHDDNFKIVVEFVRKWLAINMEDNIKSKFTDDIMIQSLDEAVEKGEDFVILKRVGGWIRHVMNDKYKNIKFVIFKDPQTQLYKIQGVPKEYATRDVKQKIPSNAKEICKGISFLHSKQFLAEADTLENAIALVKFSLKNKKEID